MSEFSINISVHSESKMYLKVNIKKYPNKRVNYTHFGIFNCKRIQTFCNVMLNNTIDIQYIELYIE